MKTSIYDNNYFFVDESGDTTFYNRKKEFIVGTEGCSKILLMGFIRTDKPELLRQEILKLNRRICEDEYLSDIPSMSKTKLSFHAKDDCSEVRYEVFKLLKKLPFTCNIVVARKTKHIYEKYNGDTQKLYDSLITNLFKNILHISNNNYIYIATRGNRKRQQPLEMAIKSSIEYSEKKMSAHIDSKQIILPQTPSGEPCLQIVDYCNWAIYRAFTCQDMRYYNYIKEKFGLIVDLYDYKAKWTNFYSKRNPFDITKISPL